jgi:hypothetical protein
MPFPFLIAPLALSDAQFPSSRLWDWQRDRLKSVVVQPKSTPAARHATSWRLRCFRCVERRGMSQSVHFCDITRRAWQVRSGGYPDIEVCTVSYDQHWLFVLASDCSRIIFPCTIISGYARMKAISPGGLNLSSITLHQELMASWQRSRAKYLMHKSSLCCCSISPT